MKILSEKKQEKKKQKKQISHTKISTKNIFKVELNTKNSKIKTNKKWILNLKSCFRGPRFFKKRFIFCKSSFYYLKLNYKKYFLAKKLNIVHKYRFWKRYKKLTYLRRHLKTTWISGSRFKFWELPTPQLNERINWLDKAYEQYTMISRKKTYDFLKDVFGILLLHIHRQTYISKNRFLQEKIFTNKLQRKFFPKNQKSWEKELYEVSQYLKYSLWYIDLRKQIFFSATNKASNTEISSKTNQLHWIRNEREPWLSPLIFKRSLFSNMYETKRKENKAIIQDVKIYSRLKNPLRTKRFYLYKRYDKLICRFGTKGKFNLKKKPRAYQIITKIFSPFYGGLTHKQFINIWDKSKKKKSTLENNNDMFLNQLESRLDVLVYRLNLAPTILWARRLIWEGAIVVNTLDKRKNWNTLHSKSKIYTFPLKLRDPKKIYSQTYWLASKWYSKGKFFLIPIRNESYEVQPGDIVQYNPLANISKTKMQPFLFKKGLNKNILRGAEPIEYWYWRNKSKHIITLGKNQQEIEQGNTFYLLFNSKHTDFANKQDRIKELFLSWITL